MADVVSIFWKKKYGLIFGEKDPCIGPVYLIYSQTISFFEIPISWESENIGLL